mmetsp:Transcript_10462/g.15602  ORF Transcript_10462/g.15602 Transcript_10462/m.15602 type:complete len:168 (+) Transcript_10462:145-648(+)|eukprot:CAMPEP_0167760018 /NCGR_PEP_ID=MMETSP0110_2-20121227/11350_1 /TAXON_ID=629695 /ORGANISM="Gymnochlora sp., Strain CCMP2014" /LENGTH=167 /DNA_ID=CAMNT_0007646477 /DNA_START=638 /DNA_END=1141 /DNA_ORIENTATION=+
MAGRKYERGCLLLGLFLASALLISISANRNSAFSNRELSAPFQVKTRIASASTPFLGHPRQFRTKMYSKGFGEIEPEPKETDTKQVGVRATPKPRVRARDEFERAALSGSNVVDESQQMEAELGSVNGLVVFLTLLFIGGVAFGGGFLLMDCLALFEQLQGKAPEVM